MTRIVKYVVCLYVLCLANMAQAERMVTDLSRHVIEITSQFSGTQLLIFGAIEREIIPGDNGRGIAIEGLDYDVIVVVQSEKRDMIIRRKEMMGPIWANRDFRTIRNIPGYYAVASTRDLKHILSEEQQKMLKAGLEYVTLDFAEPVSPEDARAYNEGFIRNMKAKKLYSQREGNISVLDDILFRAVLDFPANMPVGKYEVDVYLVRDGEVLLSRQSSLEVGKTGIERLIFTFAHDYPPWYGIMAIIIALFAGWFAGFITRKMN